MNPEADYPDLLETLARFAPAEPSAALRTRVLELESAAGEGLLFLAGLTLKWRRSRRLA